MADRRFPPPWRVEDNGACFIVKDREGQSLAYVYYEEEPGRPVRSSPAAWRLVDDLQASEIFRLRGAQCG